MRGGVWRTYGGLRRAGMAAFLLRECAREGYVRAPRARRAVGLRVRRGTERVSGEGGRAAWVARSQFGVGGEGGGR